MLLSKLFLRLAWWDLFVSLCIGLVWPPELAIGVVPWLLGWAAVSWCATMVTYWFAFVRHDRAATSIGTFLSWAVGGTVLAGVIVIPHVFLLAAPLFAALTGRLVAGLYLAVAAFAVCGTLHVLGIGEPKDLRLE